MSETPEEQQGHTWLHRFLASAKRTWTLTGGWGSWVAYFACGIGVFYLLRAVPTLSGMPSSFFALIVAILAYQRCFVIRRDGANGNDLSATEYAARHASSVVVSALGLSAAALAGLALAVGGPALPAVSIATALRTELAARKYRSETADNQPH